MDPLSTLQTLAGVIKYLWDASQKMKENKEECRRLCEHTKYIMDIIRDETKGELPPKLDVRLRQLTR